MRSLDELIERSDPAILQVEQWVAATENHCEVLSPSDARGDVLCGLQVTTRSTLGAIAYETGGILVDHGWLRLLGSGHPKLPRNLRDWNRGRSEGFLLVADDAVGGFFAINGGALGDTVRNVYYWSPDNLVWETLGSVTPTSCSGPFLPGWPTSTRASAGRPGRGTQRNWRAIGALRSIPSYGRGRARSPAAIGGLFPSPRPST